MKRRVACTLLAMLIVFSLLPVTASAASDMKISEKAIAILKQWEGFRQYAYEDNTQYSIGYGTGCEKDEFPNGITRAEADLLMRKYLAGFEKSVNSMIDRHSLKLTQNQFDALVMFSYNVGDKWSTADGSFKSAVVNGMTGNDFIFYITRWCLSSDTVSDGLLNRRLAEADLYLNGYYSTKAPSSYSYVKLDPNGGSCEVTVHGYDAMVPTKLTAVAYRTGYRFLGWYTQKEGGEWITDLDSATKGVTLYAHWQEGDGEFNTDGTPKGTAASYKRKVTGSALTVHYKNADSKTLNDGAEISIVADFVDEEGIKFGHLGDGGWIVLTDTYVTTVADTTNVRTELVIQPEVDEEDISDEGVLVTVTHDYVNYRTGAGTNNKKLGCLYYGDQIRITETYGSGVDKWGKFSKGWVCLRYTNYDAVVLNGGSNSDTMIAEGTVTASSLRIRSEASTKSDSVGTLPRNTYVEILETKEAEGMTWGNIGKGWISLKYVNWTAVTPSVSTTPSVPETPEEDSGTVETPSTPEQTPESGETTGTVTASALCIRNEAGTASKILAYYRKGDKVTILEQKTVKGAAWGKTDKGWICLSYVKLDSASAGSTGSAGTTGGSTGSSGTAATPTAPTGSITGVTTAGLNVRAGAGTNFQAVDTYVKGTKVTITEQKLVSGVTWGKTDKGWICMSYVRVDAGSGSVSTAGTVSASALCVRSAPGTNNAIVGRYVKGTAIVILETTKVGKTTWGRTDLGWVCMDYVK